MEERRRGERRKAERRIDAEGARRHVGMERRLGDRRVNDRRRSQGFASDT